MELIYEQEGKGRGDLPVHGIDIRDNAIGLRIVPSSVNPADILQANVRGSAFSNLQLARGTSAPIVGNTGSQFSFRSTRR
jgi:hypothetical protein